MIWVVDHSQYSTDTDMLVCGNDTSVCTHCALTDHLNDHLVGIQRKPIETEYSCVDRPLVLITVCWIVVVCRLVPQPALIPRCLISQQ